jgi:hypothetical protein
MKYISHFQVETSGKKRLPVDPAPHHETNHSK